MIPFIHDTGHFKLIYWIVELSTTTSCSSFQQALPKLMVDTIHGLWAYVLQEIALLT